MAFPEPEAGLVISYAYLWSNEFRRGKIEGLKNRPCAIVLVVEHESIGNKVTVAPITHTEPLTPDMALEIPPKVKAHLGLDTDRSWIILDDFDEFIWVFFDSNKNDRWIFFNSFFKHFKLFDSFKISFHSVRHD